LIERYCWAPLLDRCMRNQDTAAQREKVVPHAVGASSRSAWGRGSTGPTTTLHTWRRSAGSSPRRCSWKKAKERARGLAVRVELQQGSAEALPFDASAFDTIVTTFVLCSIPNLTLALGEMRRVLRPGGRLRFAEHGLASDPRIARWQKRLNPMWRRFSCGCNMDRPISQLVQGAGFRLEKCETAYLPGPKLLTYNYWGAATPS
jgi:SAM-dependent methyltransferase